jgi:hypothetical protein
VCIGGVQEHRLCPPEALQVWVAQQLWAVAHVAAVDVAASIGQLKQHLGSSWAVVGIDEGHTHTCKHSRAGGSQLAALPARGAQGASCRRKHTILVMQLAHWRGVGHSVAGLEGGGECLAAGGVVCCAAHTSLSQHASCVGCASCLSGTNALPCTTVVMSKGTGRSSVTGKPVSRCTRRAVTSLQ